MKAREGGGAEPEWSSRAQSRSLRAEREGRQVCCSLLAKVDGRPLQRRQSSPRTAACCCSSLFPGASSRLPKEPPPPCKRSGGTHVSFAPHDRLEATIPARRKGQERPPGLDA